MAKLTRMQKYSDYREQMANDSEASTVSDDLNKFQNELNKVKTFTSPEIETIIAEKPEEKTQSEIAAEVIEELNNEKPVDSDSDSVLKALDEIINGVSFDDTDSKEIIEEIPSTVEVISAASLADEMENTAIETEETYRDEINSIIDELIGITDITVPEITASLFEDDTFENVSVSCEEMSDNTESTDPVEITERDAETKVEETEVHVSSFEMPNVKKNDKSDAEIYAQICECSENIASVVDSERDYYGVSAPVMWVAPVVEIAEEEIGEAEPISIDEVLSGLLMSAESEEDNDFLSDLSGLSEDTEPAAYEVETESETVETDDTGNEEITKENSEQEIEECTITESVSESVHCVSFSVPSVKKNDKTDAQIFEQIEDCVKDFEMTIDSERIILGIPTPMMWVEPSLETKEDEADTNVADSTVDDIFSMFDDIEQEMSKNDVKDDEISIDDIVIPEEITAAVNELEAIAAEAQNDDVISVDSEAAVVEETDQESVTVETGTDIPAENTKTNDRVEVKVEDPIPEIVIPDDDPILSDDDDDITLTNEISINYISDALSEAESFSAKEGLKTVEDITTTIIREVDKNEEKFEHPVAVAAAEGDTEVIEIKNFSELAEEDREAVLDDTIPFVIDKKMKKEDDIAVNNDEEEDFIPNKILNIVLIALIAILLLVLGVVVYYIFLAQGLL